MPASPDHAIILFAHGARDARWAQTLQILRSALLARQPDTRVESAFLEFQTPSLEQALSDAVAAGSKPAHSRQKSLNLSGANSV